MPRRDFSAAMDEARRGLDAELSDRADERVRARLNGAPPRRRRVRRGRVAAAGAVVALTIAAGLGLRAPGPRALGGFAVVRPSADFLATVSAGAVTIATGDCELRDEALGGALQVAGPVTVRRLFDGVEVLAGRVELEVDHAHPRAAPFRVRVSHGEIVVLGTHFVVDQGAEGGEVRLQRGSIRFRADDGRERLLAPGEVLRWPLAPDPKREPGPAAPEAPVHSTPPARSVVAPPKPPPPPVVESPPASDVEALLEHLATLRSRGQYEEAVTTLEVALREHRGPATDERLSFELGAILTRQLRDAPRACAQWRQHQQAFPRGRYQTEVRQARSELGCED